MILWHWGTTLVLLWFVFRGNTRLDYRLAMLGALVPDLVDKPIGRILFRERYSSGRLWGHALLVNVALFAVLFFMRGRAKRKAVLVPIGALLHLFEDGPSLWSHPRVFWWPLFGVSMPKGGERSLLEYLTSPGTYASEAVGLTLVAWMLAAHGMLNRQGVVAFLRTGRLEAPANADGRSA